jgi:hypothetical protein
VGIERTGDFGQHARYEDADDRSQFLVGAGRLHAVRHAAEQFDHFAAFAQDFGVAAQFEIGGVEVLLVDARSESLAA